MCNLCKTKPVYEFTNKRKVCKNCYIHWFEKKILYTFRKFNMTKRDEIIYYKKEDNFRSSVLEGILRIMAQKKRIIITQEEKFNLKAIPDTTDLIAYKIVEEMIKGNSKNLRNLLPSNKKIIRPLFLFLDREVELYAKLKGLNYSTKNKKNSKKTKISKFIDDMEKKHPEIKRSILKGFLLKQKI